MSEALHTRAQAGEEAWPAWPHGARRDPECELAALAQVPPVLRRALARVAGRMIAVRGWERLGWPRLEDYATEQAGVSARELRDLAAVDRALAKLPAIDAAL